MRTRILTAVVGIPILLGLLIWAPVWLFLIAFTCAAGIALHEFYAFSLKSGRLHEFIATLGGTIFFVAVFSASQFELSGQFVHLVLSIILIVLFVHHMLVDPDMPRAVRYLSLEMLGIVYVAGLMVFLPLLKLLPRGTEWLMFTFLTVWAGDTGAYFAGRFFGRARLFPRVSPKKTWVGAWGGLAASVVAGLAAGLSFLATEPLGWLLGVAALAGIAGQIGDLCESMLKRACEVKDSGSIIPGHGGVLDRIDALLFAAPVVYLYALYLSPALRG